jgi:ABC-2 type transport system ATP-binding protein
MGEAIVVLENVSLRYGNLAAVERLSFTVRSGEILGLLGPNGSGKSSTLAVIAGILEPATGSVRVNGITKRERSAEYARCIGFVPQEPALYEELSGRTNLDFFASLYDISRRARGRNIERVLHRVGLAERAFDRVGTYSGGMLRRLNLAAALIHDPRVLLLDEPTAALDPASRDGFFQLLDELRTEGKAILFATHHLDEAERWCDRVAVLRQGHLVASGPPTEIFRDRFAAPVMIGVLREELSEPVEETIRQQLPDIDLEIVGRRVRIEAPDAEQLGMALAVLGSEGAEFDALNTPPARLDRFAEPVSAVRPASVLMGGGACSDN